MNKKLVAIAVAGMLAAPLAAEAQTANVTLYGRLNLSLEAVSGRGLDPGATQPATCVTPGPNVNCRTSDPTVYRVQSNSSRFGLRGSESLGRGLTAIFQIESGVQADAVGGVLASRDTFVGLQGAWGTVKIGHFLAPYDDVTPIFGNAPTFNTSILSTGNVWSQGTRSKADGGFDSRLGNSVRYDSPRVAGFAGSVMLSTRDATVGQGLTASANGSVAEEKRHAYVLGAGGYYTNGPVNVALVWEHNQKLRAAQLDDDAVSIAASYNFGVVEIGGVYERLDYDTATGNLKRDYWGIRATAPIGPGTLYAFYGHAGDGKGGAANGTTIGNLVKGGGTGADQWSVSYTYPLSKRTITYVGYHRTENDSRVNYPLSGGPAVVNGGNPSGFIVGLVHNF